MEYVVDEWRAREDGTPRSFSQKKCLAKGLPDDEAAENERGRVLFKPGRYLGLP
jgi:hypothetical protein